MVEGTFFKGLAGSDTPSTWSDALSGFIPMVFLRIIDEFFQMILNYSAIY